MLNIHSQIEADKHNLQQMVNLLPGAESKGKYRSIVASIKIVVKEIHNAKCLIEEKLFDEPEKVRLPLFEVEPSPVTILEEYKELSSFFGDLA